MKIPTFIFWHLKILQKKAANTEYLVTSNYGILQESSPKLKVTCFDSVLLYTF